MAEMAPHPLVQNRSIPRNPTSNRGMIHAQTTFGHHLFQIAIADRIPAIPPHTQHDQFILEMSSSEYRWPVLSHSVYLTSRAPPFATLPDELTGDGAVMRYPYYDSFPEPGVRSVRVVRPWFARARSRFVNSGILQLSMESVVDELGAARSGVPAEFPLKFNRQVAGIQTSTFVAGQRTGSKLTH